MKGLLPWAIAGMVRGVPPWLIAITLPGAILGAIHDHSPWLIGVILLFAMGRLIEGEERLHARR